MEGPPAPEQGPRGLYCHSYVTSVKILRIGAVAALLVVGGSGVGYVLVVPWLQARSRSAYVREIAPVPPLSFEKIATLDASLRETSGLAVSRRHDGVLWTHNDSGDGPWIYAIDTVGHLLARYELSGASSVDWESMDLGVCPDDARRSCLYVGDTGNNGRRRQVLTVHVVEEPDPAQPGGVLDPVGRIRYMYPHETRDAEALAVGTGGDLVLVTKGRAREILLFHLPPEAVQDAVTADTVIRLPPGRPLPFRPDWILGRTVTGASFSPSGATLAVRTYTQIFFLPWPWKEAHSEPLPSCFLSDLDLGGEAIGYAEDGTLWLTAEANPLRPATLSRVRCAGAAGEDPADPSSPHLIQR